MSSEWSFRISAELKNILGKDLITDSNIAVLELVKNSFDAHATEVNITFDGDSLVIADNGKGMSEHDVLNKWLFVAYSAKSDGSEDANYRDNIKRKFAGAKGIGRLSCDRLGRYLTLITKSEADKHVVELTIDWCSFESNTKTEFNHIPVGHRLLDASNEFLNGKTGTILKFSGLHDSWEEGKILRLKKSLEKMINPFSGADDFRIIFHVPGELENDARKRQESEAQRSQWEVLTEFQKRDVVNLEKSIINGPVANSIAEVLNLKTTKIESVLRNGRIYTCLSDRGETMYEIEEFGKFPLLEDATITLFYLNRQAKYNFSIAMGTQPIGYGSVFLFRNGFRIMPYGEVGDDSWGMDKRVQQGYNRYLGSRQILGRVDVETSDVDAFKEVSSRDGGLIKTPAYEQLMDFFNLTHRRLERYVAGVLWGDGFIRREYFYKVEDARELRLKLQDEEKESATIDHVLSNIGSKVDFLQIVKSLANDDTIKLLYYNENLANIVANVDDTEIIQSQMLEDFRRVVAKTNDAVLLQNLSDFERQVYELRRQRDAAERKAANEKEKAKEAARIAQEEREKRSKEEALRKQVEGELAQKKKQNLFLQTVGSLDVDRILKFHHDIRIHAATITNTVGSVLKLLHENRLNLGSLELYMERIGRANNKIMTIAQFATKANFSVAADAIEEDIIAYIAQYINKVLPEFYDDCELKCKTNDCVKIMRFKPLEISLVIDNFLMNSIKANASSFDVSFVGKGNVIRMRISDNGKGLDESIQERTAVFEKGFTTTNGSGLGLFNIANYVKKELNGTIELNTELLKDNRKFVIDIFIPA